MSDDFLESGTDVSGMTKQDDEGNLIDLTRDLELETISTLDPKEEVTRSFADPPNRTTYVLIGMALGALLMFLWLVYIVGRRDHVG